MSGAQAEVLNAILECALQLAKKGYAVFPCHPDKRPATKRGFYDATRDSGLIRKWFSEHFLVTGTIVIVEWHIEVFVFVRFDGRIAPVVVGTSVPRFFPISVSVHA